MSIELKMPALSPTMEKGTLAKWIVSVGDFVKSGDLLAEIETDKATMEFEAVDEGQIAALVVEAGTEDVPVGTTIALLAADADVIDASPPEAVDTAPKVEASTPESASAAKSEAPNADLVVAITATPRRAHSDDADVSATPLARRIATAMGLSLRDISGTGPRGRVVKADLGLTPTLAPPVSVPARDVRVVATTQTPPSGVPYEVVKLSGMRKTIARRLTESKQSVPHFYLTAHCMIDAMLELRVSLNESLLMRGTKISVNDMVIKAMALAMAREPDVNVQFSDDKLYRFARVDVAMAVAIEGGLITPVIPDASNLSLSAIAERSKTLAAKARDGTLLPEHYQGGTASLSNLGMYGIDEMIPVINPPQALILGIGSGIEKPWKVDGAVSLATIMSATASFDHRAIDGAAAARFMAAFRNLVEDPLQILC